MKKRFLPFSLLLLIMVLGQSMAVAENNGHYVPRAKANNTADSFMGMLRANQHTGLIDPALAIKAAQATESKDEGDLYWLSMGPNNMGGETSAIVYDKNSRVVYAGSMGGGVFKTYNDGITWHQVGDANLMVSCMAQDADGTIYVGTGDGGNAATYNGLSLQGYENSFVGKGIFSLKNDQLTQLVNTSPESLNGVSYWSYVYGIAFSGDKMMVANQGGLMYSTDKGENWNFAVTTDGEEIQGVGQAVTTTANGTFVAAVDGKLYIGTPDAMKCCSANSQQLDEEGNIIAIPAAGALLDVATAPSNDNVLYAACIGTTGNHTSIFVSLDKGNTWKVALPTVTPAQGHNVYGTRGLYNHGLAVNPTDDGVLYVMGYNLWRLQRPVSGLGYYYVHQLSDGGVTTMYEDTYLHVGLHCMTFNPNNARECFIGTDGGIFKGIFGSELTFKNCNRNYVTAKAMNVAFANNPTRTLCAVLDHGTVQIDGDANQNSMGTGYTINPTGMNYGMFEDGSQPGPSAISLVKPNTVFVTYKGTGFARSETSGADWVSTNFTENLNFSSSAYRKPLYLYENFEDDNNPNTVWAYNYGIEPVSEVTAYSADGYPFNVELSAPLAVGDSVEVHDPISSKLYLAVKDYLYMTRGALQFGQAPTWYTLSNSSLGFAGEPLSIGMSKDGDVMFVGFMEGTLCRIDNLNTVVSDTTGTIGSLAFQVTTTVIELPVEGQCITSVAVDPRDANKVIVTLGNYGNETYVLYSTNALSSEPTFVSKQGNLQEMPVYSSVIEMESGLVILGTEHGIFTTDNITSSNVEWTYNGSPMGDVPVMELKQQLVYHPDQVVYSYMTEGNETIQVSEVYPGVNNTGIIYAATYGKGIFRCENFKQYSGDGVEDNTVVAENCVSVYPNPVKDQALASFEVKSQSNVTYQIYDIAGRLVKNVNLGSFSEGKYEVHIDVAGLGSGAYVLRLNNATTKFLVY